MSNAASFFVLILTPSKENKKIMAIYEVKIVDLMSINHSLYVRGENSMFNRLWVMKTFERRLFKNWYKSVLAAWNNMISREDNALLILSKDTSDANQDSYHNNVTKYKQKRIALENAGMRMFHLLNRLIDPTAPHTWDQILSNCRTCYRTTLMIPPANPFV